MKRLFYKLSTSIFLLLLSYQYSIAQTTTNDVLLTKLYWNAVQATDQKKNSGFSYACSFISNGNSSFDWSQKNGAKVYHYTITATNGQWPDVSQDGQITFNLLNGSVTGSATLAKSLGQTTVHLQLFVDSKLDQDYIFNIDSVSPVQ